MNHFLERTIARGGSYASRASVAAGPLLDWYIGSDNPYFHKVPYHLTRTPASEIDTEDWAEFSGDPAAPKLRSRWERTGVVLGKASVLDAYTESDTSVVRAVGWQFGEAVLVGAVPYRKYERVNDDGFYEAGLRIGRGALVAAHGVWNRRTNEFEVPEHASMQGPTYESYLDGPTGLLGM